MGETHELFVLALSLVWFAGATPNSPKISQAHFCRLGSPRSRDPTDPGAKNTVRVVNLLLVVNLLSHCA